MKVCEKNKLSNNIYQVFISKKDNNMSWFTESNRWKHFVLGIPEGIISFLFAAGTATGMEVKDCHYDPDNANKPIYKWSFKNWDWLDWGCTVSGGLVGSIIKIAILYSIFKFPPIYLLLLM